MPAAPANQDAAALLLRREPWYRPPPATHLDQWARIDPAQVYEVHPVMLGKAQALLKRHPIVGLTVQRAQALVDQPLAAPCGARPFLVRTLYHGDEWGHFFGGGPGRFSVYERGASLWVEYGTVGPRTMPVARSALIVFLKRKPRKLYVSSEVEE